MKKYIYGFFILLYSGNVLSAQVSCGDVTIEKILTGPKHGAMIKISNESCFGSEGWICLDPDSEYMSESESDRVYAHLLAYHMANKKVKIYVDDEKKPVACNGNYVLLHDARTP